LGVQGEQRLAPLLAELGGALLRDDVTRDDEHATTLTGASRLRRNLLTLRSSTRLTLTERLSNLRIILMHDARRGTTDAANPSSAES
jgi:hypothetical protein